VLFTFGCLAGCGDLVDQDNSISDGEQKDVVDNDTKKEAKDNLKEANDNLQDMKKDELDNKNP
jgi:hypothetical protein